MPSVRFTSLYKLSLNLFAEGRITNFPIITYPFSGTTRANVYELSCLMERSITGNECERGPPLT